MSIVVTVKVPEGLVLATDSASTLTIIGGGQTGVAMIYNNANKLMQLADYPIGVAVWGAGNMGARTVISFIEEFENKLDPYESAKDNLSVGRTAEGLKAFLMDRYENQKLNELPPGQQPRIGVVVAGYSANEFLPEHYIFNVPEGKFKAVRPNTQEGSPEFGADWSGLYDAIFRLHHGYDPRVINIFKKLGVSDEVINKAKEIIGKDIQYPVAFGAMPLRDALAYAEYVVNTVIGRYRFVVGSPLCGGPVDIAAISRKQGFVWVKKKGIEVG